MNFLPLLALVAGAAIAIQATMNAQLGVLLKNSMLATSVAFICSFIFTVLAMATSNEHYPNVIEVKAVPLYLWFSGGVLSAFGVGMFYYLIPKIGVGTMMSYALSGQIVVAIIISHFGWFDSPIKTMNNYKLVGTILLVTGILLINKESNYAY